MSLRVLVRFTAAFSNGNDLYAVRYASDRKAPTLYAAPMGPQGGYCLVSEPLNDDDNAWAEIPDGSAVIVGESGVDVRLFSATDVPVREPVAAASTSLKRASSAPVA
jgi:glutamine amidotransferase